MPYMHQNRGGFDQIKLVFDIAIAAVSTVTVGRLKYRPIPLFALGFLLFCTNTAYALTQTRLPTAAADCTSVAGIGTIAWGNPGRAISSNNSYATATVDGTTTRYLQCLRYGFTIPLTATIDGITVEAERRSNRITDGGSRDAAMRLVQGGTIGSTDRSTATTYTNGDVTEAHGGAGDLWGLTWTPADINAVNFGTAFAATKPSSAGNSHTISVDMLRITVTYTPDTTPPTVSSLTRADPNPSAAATVSWDVVFSEAVTGVDTADFSLIQGGGVSGATITSVAGGGTTWTVTANTGSGSGTLGLNLVDNDTILDPTGNSLGGTGLGNGNYTGEVYTIDKTNPQVSSINRADPNPTYASSVSWTVLFSESVTGVGIADFTLAASGLSGASITSVTGSGDTWTVTASTGIGAGTLGLNLVDDDSIIDSTSNPLGGAGAGNGNFTGQVYTITLAPPLAAYSMDEMSWNGTAAEVSDTMGSYPGTARNSATTAGVSPAIPGSNGTCRYGVFDNGSTITSGYVELPGFPNLAADFTITAWVRTTDYTLGAQRIFIDDESNTGGYGLSLGEGGTGRVRFYSRGSSVIILDTPNVIANNTWYFVAGVADITNGVRRIYIFDAAGTILPGLPVSVASTGWGTDAGMASIGGETNSSGEPPLTNHFKGNLDEVIVYNNPLNQATLTALAQQTHACVAASVDHYELSLPTASITCLPTTVTLTACADTTSPCTNKSTSVSGQTATLASSGGSLADTNATFDATGVATTTLSYAAAANGTTVTVTLSGESTPAANSRQCCPDGTSCVVANSCSTVFNTAGFIFADSAGGAMATFPTQVAGTPSSSYYLRAVKTSTTTKACEAALVGTTAVDYAYECNDPTTCSTSNLMSVNSTTIARNNNGSVSSYLPVNMVFDTDGNAPFSFNYDDVGQVTLHTRKTAGGTLLSNLAGSSNGFMVKPGGFVLSGIQQTAAPQLINPAAANAAGLKFVKAGEQFTVSVRATTSGGTTTPNFGNEITPEGVKLTAALVTGLGLSSNPALGSTTGFGAFTNGSATGTDFSWGEVGIITLTPSIKDGDYLGVGEVTGAASGNVGRFFPHHFRVTPVPDPPTLADACLSGSFTYLGQPFTYTAAPVLTLTAENQGNTTTSNYDCGGFWKLSEPYTLAYTYTDGAGAGPTLTPNSGSASPPVTVPTATTDCNGSVSLTISDNFTYSRPALTSPIIPFTASINLAATAAQFTDTDGACFDTGSGCQGFSRNNITGATLRLGQTITSNAYGPETATITEPLILPVTIQHYNNTANWVTNPDDNCSQFTYLITPDGSITVSSSPVNPVTTTGGRGNLRLWPTADPAPAGGKVQIDYSLPAWLGPNAEAEAFFGIYRGNDRIINWRELVR